MEKSITTDSVVIRGRREHERSADIRSAATAIAVAPLTLPLIVPFSLATALVDGSLRLLRLKKLRRKVVGAMKRFPETGPWGSTYDWLSWAPWMRLSTEPRCVLARLDGSAEEIAVDALPAAAPGVLRLVCVSDTHGKHDLLRLPAGDILVHAGDITSRNNSVLGNSGRADALGLRGLKQFNRWLGRTPHAHRVVVGGNHDSALARLGVEAAAKILSNATYLEDSSASVCGLSFYGTPWSPTGRSANRAWQAAEPEQPKGAAAGGVHVLVTHLYHAGLARALSPALVVSGHVHEAHGVCRAGGALAVNAATCDALYRPLQLPIVIDLPSG